MPSCTDRAVVAAVAIGVLAHGRRFSRIALSAPSMTPSLSSSPSPASQAPSLSVSSPVVVGHRCPASSAEVVRADSSSRRSCRRRRPRQNSPDRAARLSRRSRSTPSLSSSQSPASHAPSQIRVEYRRCWDRCRPTGPKPSVPDRCSRRSRRRRTSSQTGSVSNASGIIGSLCPESPSATPSLSSSRPSPLGRSQAPSWPTLQSSQVSLSRRLLLRLLSARRPDTVVVPDLAASAIVADRRRRARPG